MFKKYYNKGAWLRVANNAKTEKLKGAVMELFIPYKIDITKYSINEDCFKREDSYDYETRQYCTTSLAYWIERLKNEDMPMGFPGWFYPAFPDVAKWTQTPEARIFLEPMFEFNKPYLEDRSDGKLSLYILKKVVSTFIISTGKKLEVSI